MRNGLVEGVSLRAVLRESGAMAPEAAASVLAGMLVTLAVVHGDVRPEHVRVNGSGGIALTDFAGPSPRFVPNAPTYLAPERLRGAPASPAGDVFSAAAVFFECLTNETSFVAATRDDLAALHEYAQIIAEFAPPQVSPLVQRGLAMDPSRRPSSPHEFLDEVTTAVAAAYGPDWQQRGQALLGEWAAAAARTDGVELAVPPARTESLLAASEAAEAMAAMEAMGAAEAPPVGEPIDEALLGLEVEDAAPEAAESEEAMPPPVGEPIDTALLGLEDEPGGDIAAEAAGAEADAEDADEPESVAEPADAPEAGDDHDDKDYDWFSGSAKTTSESGDDAPSPETDVLAVFDGARAGRSVEPAPADYPPTGFDVFADRSAESAEAEAPDEADTDAEFEPLIEDSELFAAFDAFSPPATETPDTADTAETPAAETSAGKAEADTSAEPLPKRDPFAGLGIETLAASSLLPESTAPAPPEAVLAEPEPEPEAEPEAKTEPEPTPEPGSESEPEAPVASDPEPDSASPDSPASLASTTSPADLEDDWVFPTKPSPKAPRSLSAFAVSLPSLPRPRPEAEEPAPPVRTSAPDDWFRPGVTEAAGSDADQTRVINPDRDITVESQATRTLDEVPAAAATVALAAPGKGADERNAPDVGIRDDEEFDDDFDDHFDDEFGEPDARSGPRRKTLIGAVTTAVLLVAGAAAVVLGGSGNSPQGTSGTPAESSATTPSPTGLPSTPVGTSDAAGDGTTSTANTPSSRHSTTHSRSRTSSPATTTHSSSDETSTRGSSSQTSTDHSTSPTSTPTNSTPTSPSGSCLTGLLGPVCGSTPSAGGTSTRTVGN